VPITYCLDGAHQRVLTTVSGPATYPDVHAHFEALRAAGALVYPELVDATKATPPWMSASTISRVAQLIFAAPADSRFGPRAVVVKGELPFRMARLFGILVNAHLSARVFRDVAAAQAWLGSIASAGSTGV
jgi:hypothetical protein